MSLRSNLGELLARSLCIVPWPKNEHLLPASQCWPDDSKKSSWGGQGSCLIAIQSLYACMKLSCPIILPQCASELLDDWHQTDHNLPNHHGFTPKYLHMQRSRTSNDLCFAPNLGVLNASKNWGPSNFFGFLQEMTRTPSCTNREIPTGNVSDSDPRCKTWMLAHKLCCLRCPKFWTTKAPTFKKLRRFTKVAMISYDFCW